MKKQGEEYIEIDLTRLMKAMLRRAWIILLAMLIGGSAAFLLAAFVIPPTYRASVMLYVNNSTLAVGGTTVDLSDLTASQSLVKTYIVILKTRRTLNAVIEEAGLSYTCKELEKMIEADSENGTEIFYVTVTNRDPEEAAKIANTITEVLPDKIAEIVDGCSVRTVDFAVVPTKKFEPSITKCTALGLAIGLLLSCGVIVALEFMDDQIHDEDYLLQTYGLPMLAAIPDLFARPKKGEDYTSYHLPPNGG